MSFVHRTDQPDRRHFVGALGALAGFMALSAGAKPAAKPQPFKAPVVDSLTIQVLVDAAAFGPFLPDLTLPGLQVLRSSRGSGEAPVRMSAKAAWAEFGLSLLATSQSADQTRRVLIDFGYTPDVIANNLTQFGIDPDQINAAVLSHGHLDHYGGFSGVFANAPAKMRKIPLIVGGEETFCERLAMIGNPPPVMGSLDRAKLASAGFDVQIRPEPIVVADQAFTTGIIPLKTTERTAIPTQMRPGVACDAAKLSVNKQSQTQLPDDGEHELATCYAVKDLGLVVIVSCGHRGVLNSIKQAQAVSGIEKIHAVVGGFHLVAPRTPDEARATAAELAKINPDYIIPMHCTGEVFIAEATRLMPEKIIRPYIGNRLVFSNS